MYALLLCRHYCGVSRLYDGEIAGVFKALLNNLGRPRLVAVVKSNYSAMPDLAIVADVNISDNLRQFANVCLLSERWLFPIKPIEH